MAQSIGSKLLLTAALALAVPAQALAKADPCQGKAEGGGKGVVLGAPTRVRVVVEELHVAGKPAKFTLENSTGEPPLDLAVARKGSDRFYPGPVELHLCARPFHARESCVNKATYRPGRAVLETANGYRVTLKVSCK